MSSEKDLLYEEYISREEFLYHKPYRQEFDFYEEVKQGNIEYAKKLKTADFTIQPGLGKLSKSKVQSAKYHFAIAAAMMARYCIEGGMEHENAYNTSDVYINKADTCRTTKEISKLQYEMILYYTTYMYNLRKKNVYSLSITNCIEYIYKNLHKRLYIKDLAKAVNLSEGHLSRLFKEETGRTITDYIKNKKIETAQNMLLNSDFSISQISETFCFPSQSYFIKVFKEKNGITPFQYRKFGTRKLEI